MRFYIYIISGIVLALVGWNLSELLLIGASESVGKGILPLPADFPPDFILLPIVAACLAVAMVVTEIFLSNPTRYKANKRVLPPYLWGALGTGVVAGLITSALTWVLYQTGAPAGSVRVVSWSLIGLFTGLGEGVSWRLRSIEGGTKRATPRVWRATLFGLGAGLAAAILVEILRKQISLGGYEDPIGFLILGLSLGSFLSLATSPTYQVALRAGQGFEAVDSKLRDSQRDHPRLNQQNHPALKFVTGDHYDFIEEGLSIQLPPTRGREIIIGSAKEADIHIPNIPLQAASLQVSDHNVMLRCLAEGAVQIQSRRLVQGGRSIPLRHNQILTFYQALDEEKYYRFVFYDRFLDPEA
ncbi:MAG: hypothetical protein AB1589_38305 [Cyanobacteriota bacterium]